MANCRWAILCREATIDAGNSDMTLNGIVEELHFTGTPPKEPNVAKVSVQLIALWDRTDYKIPESPTARYIMVGPDGHRSHAGELDVDLTEHRRYRTRLKLEGLPVTGPGIYHLLIETRTPGSEIWAEASRSPLEVFWNEPAAVS